MQKQTQLTSEYRVSEFLGLNTAIKDTKTLKVGTSIDALNWLFKRDHMELRRGMAILGATRQTGAGKITGLKTGLKFNGTEVPFRTRARKIEYYDLSADDWVEVGTNSLPLMASGEDVAIENYESLAGAFVYISSPNSSVYKIPVSNPGSLVDQSLTDHRGLIKIGQSRMFLWNRKSASGQDPTGLYLSHIDHANLSDYTAITGEAVGAGGSTNYTGTLAFKAGGAKRTCMWVIFNEATGEQLTDDRNGNIIDSKGVNVGTINYATGVYNITFDHTTAGAVTATYYWEDATSNGICDFTFSGTRVAGEGATFRQDDGGGKFQNLFAYKDVEYCFHEFLAWALTLTNDDTAATNYKYRNQLGIPYWRAGFATDDGILYINAVDPNYPLIGKISLAQFSSEVLPTYFSEEILDLSDYYFDKAVIFEFGDFILAACRTSENTENDTIFLFDQIWKTWAKLDYKVSSLDIYGGTLIAGDNISNNIYTLFSGLDEDGDVIDNYVIMSDTNFGLQGSKRFYRMVFDGLIGPDQNIDIYASYDNGDYVKVGNVSGNGSYVDKGTNVSVGALTIGSKIVGGGSGGIDAFHFRREIIAPSPIFEYVKIKFVATGIGFSQINEYSFKDVRLKSSRIPVQYSS